ncbi:hypothetical protein [Streptomyces aidingensis]|uniref:Uncharacterized protein n=1 Tax=Streptomyces aidingensis TaxID=910347 RepID=A0A1I1M6P2_9ACTN|nr:hypothetical protein [Streptomyces aidingensis]SFC81167.1 hypothetical protein SAMN05421773_106131 [Streptomyces aidingensis]
MADSSSTEASTEGPVRGDRRGERETARLAKWVRAFAAAHGGSADGQIAYLGARGFRLLLVGADGAWGDLVARRRESAEHAAARAGVTLHETLDGELAARMRTGPYEWSRMAGSQLGGPRNP